MFYRALHHARMMEYAGRCADLRDKYQAGGLAEYEEIDTVRYTLRVVYVYSRLAQAYDVHDIQPYNMDEAELARLQADEARLGAYACAQANSAEGWREWLRTSWVRELLNTEPEVFLLAPLREGRQQFFTKPQVDLYDKLLKIHIFQINTFCILQHSFENFKDYFVGSARTSRKNVYGKGWR